MSEIRLQIDGTEVKAKEGMTVLEAARSVGIFIPFTGLSVGEVFDRFRTGLDASRTLFIVVLDEVDTLIKDRGDHLLYELTRINETLHKSRVAIIGISNDLRLKEFLDPRVFSSLSE